MARVNFSGFETGISCEDAVIQVGGSIQTTTVRTGTYAYRSNPTGTATMYAQLGAIGADGINATANVATSYVRFYFLFLTGPASGTAAMFDVVDTSLSGKAQLKISSTGLLSFWNSVTNTQLGSTGTTVLASGVWYCIEVKVGSGASNVAWEVRIDGVSEISGSSTLGAANNSGLWYFGRAVSSFDASVDFYYDDIAIDDAAYPGPGSIVRLDPNADVAKTNWLNQAASSTNLFQSVDDLASQAGHDTDSTYIVTSTSGVVTYTASFPALSTRQIIGTINEIKFIAFGRDTGTTLTWRIALRPASNSVQTTALDVGGSTYAMRAILYKTSGGTDALTIANVNTCQASFVHVQANARELRCTAMALMLDLPGVFSPPKNISQAVKRAAFI